MTANELIFSDKIKNKVVRHSLFWGIYCFICFLQVVDVKSTGELLSSSALQIAFTRLVCFTPACVISVYISINILWPTFIKKKRYTAFVFSFIALIALLIWVNYYCVLLFYYYTKPGHYFHLETILSFDINDNTTHAVNIAIIALGFKFAKHWFLQQQENLILAKQKVITNIRLLKGRLQPDFLIASLANLYSSINTGSGNAAPMILKLSNILSYILYDCDEEQVSLEKELPVMQDFIALEEMKHSRFFTMHTQINGDSSNLYISPFILLPFLQDFFVQVLQNESNPSLIDINILVTNKDLRLTLSTHQNNVEIKSIVKWNENIQNTRNRLNALYPGLYVLEIKRNEQSIISTLNIKLRESNIYMTSEVLQNTVKDVYESI